MQPQQQPYQNQPQSPVEQTPYDFILNAPAPGKSPTGGPSSMKQRLIVIVGIFALLVTLLIVFMAIMSGGGNGKDTYLRVQQLQTETVRISDIIATDATSQTVKNVAFNTQLSVMTDKQRLTGVLSATGITFSEEELALGANAEAQTTFTNAQAAGTINTTALTYLQEQVDLYVTALAEAYSASSSAAVKEELNREYAAAELLAKQLKSTIP